MLLAASSVSIAFLGREAFEHSDRTLLIAVAVSAFAISTAASVYLVLPRPALVAGVYGSTVYEQFHRTVTDLEEVHRQLAYDLDAFCDTNDPQLDRLVRAFAVSAAALAIELLALVAVLATTIA